MVKWRLVLIQFGSPLSRKGIRSISFVLPFRSQKRLPDLHFWRTVGLALAILLVFIGCQKSEETRYLNKMWAWHSLEMFAFTPQSKVAMFAELQAIAPPRGWYGQHMSLVATYQVMLVAEENEDILQKTEEVRFRALGSDEVPGCDVLRSLSPGPSTAYRLACEMRAEAQNAWSIQSALWTVNYLEDRGITYSLSDDASALSRKSRIESSAPQIMQKLVEIAENQR